MVRIYSIASLLEAIQKCAEEQNLRVQFHDGIVHLCRHFAHSYRVLQSEMSWKSGVTVSGMISYGVLHPVNGSCSSNAGVQCLIRPA